MILGEHSCVGVWMIKVDIIIVSSVVPPLYLSRQGLFLNLEPIKKKKQQIKLFKIETLFSSNIP